MTRSRDRRKKRHRNIAFAPQPKGVCPMCKAPGVLHFVPPSLGDPGFYICDRIPDGMVKSGVDPTSLRAGPVQRPGAQEEADQSS